MVAFATFFDPKYDVFDPFYDLFYDLEIAENHVPVIIPRTSNVLVTKTGYFLSHIYEGFEGTKKR